jgi:cyclin C
MVHHPYRTLLELQTSLGLTADEIALSWSVINDHYLTDLPLLHPPHVIGVTAILMSVVFKPSHQSMSAGSGGGVPPGVAGALRDGTASASLFAVLGDKSGGGMPPRVQKLIEWLAASEVKIEAVIECTQEIISLYEVWEQYSEKLCKEQIGRFVKARGMDK